MTETLDYLEEVSEVVKGLGSLGFKPIMIGGMALVILGSRRVTRDFDFVISNPEDKLEAIIGIFYDRGLELVSRLDKNGEVTGTIDNRKVAAIRLHMDAPLSAYFFNAKTGLRIDLLFDFPLPAAELIKDVKKTKILSHVFHVASKKALIRLKEIAKANRSIPGDEQDLAFLKSLPKKTK